MADYLVSGVFLGSAAVLVLVLIHRMRKFQAEVRADFRGVKSRVAKIEEESSSRASLAPVLMGKPSTEEIDAVGSTLNSLETLIATGTSQIRDLGDRVGEINSAIQDSGERFSKLNDLMDKLSGDVLSQERQWRNSVGHMVNLLLTRLAEASRVDERATNIAAALEQANDRYEAALARDEDLCEVAIESAAFQKYVAREFGIAGQNLINAWITKKDLGDAEFHELLEEAAAEFEDRRAQELADEGAEGDGEEGEAAPEADIEGRIPSDAELDSQVRDLVDEVEARGAVQGDDHRS